MLDDVTEVNVGSLAPDFRLESNGGQSFVSPSIGDARMWSCTLCASLLDCNVSAMPSSWDGCMNSFVRGTPRCSLLGVAAARALSACLQGTSCRFPC